MAPIVNATVIDTRLKASTFQTCDAVDERTMFNYLRPHVDGLIFASKVLVDSVPGLNHSNVDIDVVCSSHNGIYLCGSECDSTLKECVYYASNDMKEFTSSGNSAAQRQRSSLPSTDRR